MNVVIENSHVKEYINVAIENYIIQNCSDYNNLTLSASFLSSIITVGIDGMDEKLTYEYFIDNAYMYTDKDYDLDNDSLNVILTLSGPISIKEVNSDYTLKEIYDIFIDQYLNNLLGGN